MGSGTAWKQYASVFILLLGGGISLIWGIALEKGTRAGVMGFPGIYFGTRCLLEKCDPYNVQDLERFYEAQGFATPSESVALRQSVTLYVNLPATFLFVAPFALLPLGTAQLLWMILVVGSFSIATLLMWNLGRNHAPDVSLILAFLLISNCEVIFAGGNTAGLVVSLCVLSVWCFLQQRFLKLAVVCLAVSLLIKPHDAGLIWLYFLVAGPLHRKRALLSAALAIGLGAAAIVWVSHVAPSWPAELRTNLAAISGPGGINEPGPTSIGVSSPDMIIDLQTVLSVFVNAPQIYNVLSYLMCALLLCAWLLAVRRSEQSTRNTLFALVSVAALSMLVTYHRSYDAKLLLLAIPACAMVWKEGKRIRWIAFALSAGTVLMTGDIPLAMLTHATRNLRLFSDGLTGKILFVLLARPAPLLLLAVSVFYLVLMMRPVWGGRSETGEAREAQPIDQAHAPRNLSSPAM
ncbi:MAG: glycosyltransferase family 87 protein [Terracidiphilus sp.]